MGELSTEERITIINSPKYRQAEIIETELMRRHATDKTVGDGVDTVSYLMDEINLIVLAERERCAKLEGVPFADWLLDWFDQNAPTRYDNEEVGGYTFIQIADLSKMLERRFTAAIREDPPS